MYVFLSHFKEDYLVDSNIKELKTNHEVEKNTLINNTK